MRKGFTLIILPIVIILVVVIGLQAFKFIRSSSNKVQLGETITKEFSQKYLEVWKNLFLEENRNITESYFKIHITPQFVGLNKKNPLGEELFVKYKFRVDWVEMTYQDRIIVKPNEDDHYHEFRTLGSI